MQVLSDINFQSFHPDLSVRGGAACHEAALQPLEHKAGLSQGIFDLIRYINSGGEVNPFDDKEIAAMLEQLVEWSLTDELTGLPNRRMFSRYLEYECKRSFRSGQSFGLVLIDLDYFKDVNDIYGHQKGDQILKDVADTLRENLRETDFVARYGGEEFCAVLPNTSKQDTLKVAKKMRVAVCALPSPAPTISAGVALWRPGVNSADLIRAADRALYRAKESGRNMVRYGGGRQAALA